MKRFDYGKYRGIIISIVLFLILDASVLLMNFYISFEIADDAIGVNIAGRQRMLSQRMMKSLLDIKTSLGDDAEVGRAISELSSTTQLFDQTLNAFDVGGQVQGTDGNPALIHPVSSEKSLNAIASSKQIWRPYLQSIDRLLAIDYNGTTRRFMNQLDATAEYGTANNLQLLALMNTMTTDLEHVARSKANTLRMIQLAGMSLAILNFIFIIFHSIRQLRASDRKIDEAQHETREILDTVNEGLFLLDQMGEIGEQQSSELERIFGRKILGGMPLLGLLKNLVSEQELQTARKYLGLVFDPRKKEKLIGSLNPLREIEVHIALEDGSYQSKFLNFTFSRVMTGTEIIHVLVTVTDITRQVELAKELESVKRQGEQQLKMLNSIVHSGSDMIPAFLENSFQSFQKINSALRHTAKSKTHLIHKANYIYRLIHNFKGEATALNLDQFAEMADKFEQRIDEIKSKPNLCGSDFLPLTISLDHLISQAEATHKLMSKISTLSGESSPIKSEARSKTSWSHLQHLADSVGTRQDKKTEVLHSGLNDYELPEEITEMINVASIQLIRNAVAHGIEKPSIRRNMNKPETGRIDIRLTKRKNGELQLSFSDDGAGLDLEGIRRAAIAKGLLSDHCNLDDDKKRIISTIFAPDISTKTDADQDAGRGMGMSSVNESVRALGGRVSVSSRKGKGSTFTITLPAQSHVSEMAA